MAVGPTIMSKALHNCGTLEVDLRIGHSTGAFGRRVLTYYGASFVQGLLTLAVVPLTTLLLGPAEFGAYGIAIAAVTLACSLADIGTGIVLSGHYFDTDAQTRKQLVATLFSWTIVSGAAASIALYIFWPTIGRLASDVSIISETDLVLACLSVPLRLVVGFGTQVLVIQFRAMHLGTVMTLQSAAVLLATLVALFVFDQGQTALFIGNVVGAAIGCAAMVILLWEDIAALPTRCWSTAILRAAPSGTLASILDNARALVESTVMVRAVGVYGLGIYNHSRLYHGYLMQIANAVGNSLWPLALQEARLQGSSFEKVGRAWNAIYLILTIAGVGLAAFGIEVVSILTNGKFVEAAPWAPLWVAYLLLQNCGKPHTATLYAAKRGAAVARYRIISLALAIAALVVFVPAYGIPAAITISFGEMLIFRLLLRRGALAIRRLPFQDGWVIAGCCTIVMVTAVIQGLSLELPARCAIFVVVTAVLLVVGRSIALDALAHIRGSFSALHQKGNHGH